jgi:glycosyltransferase involved in cell wall biosynthesis
MRLGVVIEETWAFFKEIYAEFSQYHQTTLFERRSIQLPFFEERVNKTLFYRDIRSFLRNNQVVFFEWASELLQIASTQPKTCGIVTRLHRYEMYRWSDRIHWDTVDKIILVSQAKEREFLRRFPSQVGKTCVIPESIALERFQPQLKPYRGDIGILCHLTPRKRVYELILAFNELLRQNDNFRLHIGGGMRSDLVAGEEFRLAGKSDLLW